MARQQEGCRPSAHEPLHRPDGRRREHLGLLPHARHALGHLLPAHLLPGRQGPHAYPVGGGHSRFCALLRRFLTPIRSDILINPFVPCLCLQQMLAIVLSSMVRFFHTTCASNGNRLRPRFFTQIAGVATSSTGHYYTFLVRSLLLPRISFAHVPTDITVLPLRASRLLALSSSPPSALGCSTPSRRTRRRPSSSALRSSLEPESAWPSRPTSLPFKVRRFLSSIYYAVARAVLTPCFFLPLQPRSTTDPSSSPKRPRSSPLHSWWEVSSAFRSPERFSTTRSSHSWPREASRPR